MARRLVLLFCAVLTLVSPALCNAKQRFYKTLSIDVPLDHFSFSSNTTFKLRYLLNDTYWDKANGPVLFYTGNEGSIELFAKHTGLMWKLAPDLKALIVFAEHRYYGESLPFGNESLTPQKIGYLTSSQAIADYVDLITFLLKDKSASERNPVIAFGGSYGGMLSAYIRMKYPHVVLGAIAASAPILQFKGLTPCDSFYRIVTSSYYVNGKNCTNNIKRSWPVFKNKTSTDEGRAWITKEFKLCKPLKEGDVKSFKEWLMDVYTNLAMVNYPYDNDFLAPLPGYPVRQACLYLKDGSIKGDKLLQAISTALSVYTNFTRKTKCNDLDADYENDLGTKAWGYQACTEMVMPMCTTGVSDMFEDAPWDEEGFNLDCFKKWNVKPAYQLPIEEYGGSKSLQYASNIIFSNGLLDPWASGGVLRNYSETVMAVLIPEGAHHLDLMDDNKDDPFSVVWARTFHKASIQNWIKASKRGSRH